MNPSIRIGSHVESRDGTVSGFVVNISSQGVILMTDYGLNVTLSRTDVIPVNALTKALKTSEPPTNVYDVDPIMVLEMPEPFCRIDTLHLRPDKVCEARDRKGNLITLISASEAQKVFGVDLKIQPEAQ